MSAFGGRDFTAIQETLTFDPWETRGKVQIPLVNDDVKESHKNFYALVSDVTGGMVGTPWRANVALWDDDSK